MKRVLLCLVLAGCAGGAPQSTTASRPYNPMQDAYDEYAASQIELEEATIGLFPKVRRADADACVAQARAVRGSALRQNPVLMACLKAAGGRTKGA